MALLPLRVEGNRILRDGEPFVMRGVNRDTLEWGRHNWGGVGGDGRFRDRDFDNIRSWGFDTVRLPLSQANWLGRRCESGRYARLVDAAVKKINARGMYAILDLHWTDVGGLAPCDGPRCKSGQQPMPDADSLVFWRGVAARYGREPGVLFNLFNEPYVYHRPFVRNLPDEASWRCWRDGGCTVYASMQTSPRKAGLPVPLPYTAVGMQTLLDAVREEAPETVVIVGGLDWAYDLSGVGRGYALSGTNVVYDTHVYTRWHHETSDWDRHFGFLAATHPVVSLEFGSVDGSAGRTARLLDYFDAPMGQPENSMGWAIWSWNSPGEASQPTVLADWGGTPLPDQGTLIHSRLSSRRGS